MPALPRSYFAEPDPFEGWSEERKRFFMEYGYDPKSTQKKDVTKATRTTTTTTDDDGFSKTVVKDTEDLTEARANESGGFIPEFLQSPSGTAGALLNLVPGVEAAEPTFQETWRGGDNVWTRKAARDAAKATMSGPQSRISPPSGGGLLSADPLAEKAEFMGEREEQQELYSSKPRLWLSRVLGLPVDSITAGINALVSAAGGPDSLIDDPMMGSKWIMELNGWTLEDLGAATKDALGATVEGVQTIPETLWPGQSELIGPDRSGGIPTIADAQADGTTTGGGLLEETPAEISGMTQADIHDAYVEKMEPFINEQNALASAKDVAEVAAEDIDDDRIWANFSQDVTGKKERYLAALKEIYKKASILNVIGALTNSPSQAPAFMKLAAEKFKMLEGFRGEERLQDIARGVFFLEDGTFDAPKSKQEAFERALQFGASHSEAETLSGHMPETKATKYPTTKKAIVTDKNHPDYGQIVWATDEQIAGGGYEPVPEKDPQGTSWERATAAAADLAGTDREGAINIIKRHLIGADRMFKYVPAQALEAATVIVDDILKGVRPPSSDPTDTPREDLGYGNAPQAAIDALKADPTPEKKKQFLEMFGSLPGILR